MEATSSGEETVVVLLIGGCFLEAVSAAKGGEGLPWRKLLLCRHAATPGRLCVARHCTLRALAIMMLLSIAALIDVCTVI